MLLQVNQMVNFWIGARDELYEKFRRLTSKPAGFQSRCVFIKFYGIGTHVANVEARFFVDEQPCLSPRLQSRISFFIEVPCYDLETASGVL